YGHVCKTYRSSSSPLPAPVYTVIFPSPCVFFSLIHIPTWGQRRRQHIAFLVISWEIGSIMSQKTFENMRVNSCSQLIAYRCEDVVALYVFCPDCRYMSLS
ncbi:hypothetical protein PENTCL1PPCAC_18813, partial [Pristionchus entomophagus]